MEIGRQYDEEYKKQAVQLAKDVGNAAGTKEFGISSFVLMARSLFTFKILLSTRLVFGLKFMVDCK